MKKFVIIVILLVVGAGIVYGIMQYRNANKPDTQAADAKPKAIKAEVGTIDLRVSTTGKIVSNLDVDIKSKASGTIVKLPFDISDKVTSGDLLCELDPVDENRNVSLAQEELLSAKARLAQAEQQYEMARSQVDTGTSNAISSLEEARVKNTDAQSRLARGIDLFQKQLLSKEDLDTLKSDAAAAQRALKQAEVALVDTRNLTRTLEMKKQDISLNNSQVTQNQVSLDTALQRLIETKIYAPMDGVVTSRPVQTGMIIASGISNVGGGTTLMTLSDLSRIFVSASVDESDIGKVKIGQRATITADAFPGKRFRGKVMRVAAKGVTSSNVVTFEVKIEVNEEGREFLRPEMTANIEIQCDRHEDVLTLPNEAVQFGKEGYFVEVPIGDDKTTRAAVKTGITDGLNTEIVAGLKDGEEVKLPSMLQSRWARQGDPRSGFNRGMQMATYSISGAGRRR